MQILFHFTTPKHKKYFWGTLTDLTIITARYIYLQGQKFLVNSCFMIRQYAWLTLKRHRSAKACRMGVPRPDEFPRMNIKLADELKLGPREWSILLYLISQFGMDTYLKQFINAYRYVCWMKSTSIDGLYGPYIRPWNPLQFFEGIHF